MYREGTIRYNGASSLRLDTWASVEMNLNVSPESQVLVGNNNDIWINDMDWISIKPDDL